MIRWVLAVVTAIVISGCAPQYVAEPCGGTPGHGVPPCTNNPDWPTTQPTGTDAYPPWVEPPWIPSGGR